MEMPFPPAPARLPEVNSPAPPRQQAEDADQAANARCTGSPHTLPVTALFSTPVRTCSRRRRGADHVPQSEAGQQSPQALTDAASWIPVASRGPTASPSRSSPTSATRRPATAHATTVAPSSPGATPAAPGSSTVAKEKTAAFLNSIRLTLQLPPRGQTASQSAGREHGADATTERPSRQPAFEPHCPTFKKG
ncbi:hypothetical protein SEVIR_4G247001v4 [Setaria viridis]